MALSVRPPVQAAWMYAIGADNTKRLNAGATPSGTVISLDLLDVKAASIARLRKAGRYVICYYSAGTSESYRTDVDSSKLLTVSLNLGEVGRGGGEIWEGEKWLDIRGFGQSEFTQSRSARIATIKAVMTARLKLAQSKGCQAVEPDNVDAWSNDVSQKAPAGTRENAISAADQLVYNRWTVDTAHGFGLAALLKNDLNQASTLVSTYDGALNEECLSMGECGLLKPFADAGKAIYIVEYEPASFVTAAHKKTASKLHLNVILTDLDVNLAEPLARFGSW
ncbi:hypothetical protein EHF33_17990 (plasmid) [Deinococcus psychrotolerans]|uniref:Glycoside-hydrolase family GH114 TIM-barrel domain-containing protein n=1 Tax=Deinococcus psychrotolerans TaxID=2489213 RepID=A0A3G8YQF4_9DEIO|nr:endo alpha-1,4 polygalactosaminidase [Deinococcus psychrotolerans]AZI44814.1 hypothetical protein EHF33_17990 [Deinococcus psychrotolerans]